MFTAGHDPGLITSGATVWSTTPQGGDLRVIGTAREEPRCSFSLDCTPLPTAVAVMVADGLTTRVELRNPAGGDRWSVLHETRSALGTCHAAGERLAVIEASRDRPAEVYAGSPGKLVRLSDHGAHLEGLRLGVGEEFSWTAPDGVALDGVLIRPPGATRGPLPAVVLPHGGPYGRSVPGLELGWHAWGTWLAGAGYVALLPNYRGGLGHGHDFARAAAGGVGGVELSDVLSMVDAAVERGIADPGRLAVAGWSQGGFLAAAAVTQTHRFRAAVVGAGPVDWDMMSVTSDLGRFEAELAGGPPWETGARRGRRRALAPPARDQGHDPDPDSSWPEGRACAGLPGDRVLARSSGERCSGRAGSPIHGNRTASASWVTSETSWLGFEPGANAGSNRNDLHPTGRRVDPMGRAALTRGRLPG